MSSPQQESFQSMATVFILQEKTWIERGSGLVRFVFDLRTFALRLVIRPGTNDEFECKLRPRIRSKGPRAYVVRAQADSGNEEHILAVRFEREEDSRSFRRFVEKRDVDHNHTSKSQQKTNPSYQAHPRNAPYESGKYIDPMTAAVQQQSYGRHPNRSSGGYYGQPRNSYQNPSALAMYNNQHVSGPPDPSNPNKGLSSSYFWTCSRCLQMVDCTLSSCHVCGSLRPMTADPNNHPMTNAPNNDYPPNNAYGHHNPHAHPSHNNHPSHSNANQHPHAHQQSMASHHASNYYANQPQILQSIQPQNTNSNKHHNVTSLNRHNQSNATQATYGSSSRHHANSHKHYASQTSGSGAVSGKASASNYQAPVLKLTQVNLEKHNKLFPPKRRNVKEVIHVQLEYLRTHQ